VIDTQTNGRARRLAAGTIQMFVRDPSGNLVEIACDADQAVDPDVLADEAFVAGTV
jgi:lactoylglutathione lyase